MNADERSILAVHPGALGDVVLFGHILRAMGGGATLLAGGEKARLLEGLGVVERGVDFDSLPMHEIFGDQPLDQCRLPRLLGRCRRLMSCFAAGNKPAEERLTLLTGAARADFLPVRPPEDFGGHLLELWARQLGVEAPSRPVAWPVPPAWRGEARELLARAGIADGTDYWVIHPGAGAERKCWPLARFLQAADAGAARLGRPVLVLGPVEEERWGDAARQIGRRTPAILSPPFSALTGLLAGATAYLGNDSGVSHLSAAVGTVTVAVFQQPGEVHFAPRGRRVEVVCGASLAELPVGRVVERLGGPEERGAAQGSG